MMRLLSIGFVWIGCLVAWMVLGSTLVTRSGEKSYRLLDEVHRLWGAPATQNPPRAFYRVTRTAKEVVRSLPLQTDARGNTIPAPTAQAVIEREVVDEIPVPLAGSQVEVDLALEHRRKGLLWFPTYGVDFRGRFAFENPSAEARSVELLFPLSSTNAGFDDFQVTTPDGASVATTVSPDGASWKATFAPKERKEYRVRYRTRGTSTWHYALTAGTGQVREFRLAMTADTEAIDFPAGTVSPTRHAASAGRWSGVWEFKSLIASAAVGVELPQRLNPGPVASRITFFAPVGLLFFFFAVAVLAAVQRKSLHPMHFFFLGCAFFAFHLLFAYLVDHLELFTAFATAAAVSVFLVVTYARLFVGWRFALREMGTAQALYLVLFSFTFFWQGFTGLSITVGAILTLFVMMQITGRVEWSGARDPARAAP